MRTDKVGRRGGDEMKGGRKRRGMKKGTSNNIHITVRINLYMTGPS